MGQARTTATSFWRDCAEQGTAAIEAVICIIAMGGVLFWLAAPEQLQNFSGEAYFKNIYTQQEMVLAQPGHSLLDNDWGFADLDNTNLEDFIWEVKDRLEDSSETSLADTCGYYFTLDRGANCSNSINLTYTPELVSACARLTPDKCLAALNRQPSVNCTEHYICIMPLDTHTPPLITEVNPSS